MYFAYISFCVKKLSLLYVYYFDIYGFKRNNKKKIVIKKKNYLKIN